MQIQVNTDNHTEGSQELNNFVQSTLEENFKRFKVAITRIEVHFSDLNASKEGPDDKRCLIEARLSNRQPIAVSHQAENIHQAFDGACEKLERSLNSLIGKLEDRTSIKDLIVEEAVEDEDDFSGM